MLGKAVQSVDMWSFMVFDHLLQNSVEAKAQF